MRPVGALANDSASASGNHRIGGFYPPAGQPAAADYTDGKVALDVNRCHRVLSRLLTATVLCAVAAGHADAQTTARLRSPQGKTPHDPQRTLTQLSATTFAMGQVRIDVAKREVLVPGRLNAAATLEFVANSTGGVKAYESAMTLDASAIAFNTALLLIGLDPARARVPREQFDPVPPKGDPVELTVTLTIGGKERRIPVEELIFDSRTQTTLPPGPWVYTGSTFVQSGAKRHLLAELDGVLIGLMHGPQALIDNPRNDAMGGFGYVMLNPRLGLPDEARLTLTVRALDRPRP